MPWDYLKSSLGKTFPATICSSLLQNERVHPERIKKTQHTYDRASQHINSTLLKNTYLQMNTYTLLCLYSEWRVFVPVHKVKGYG